MNRWPGCGRVQHDHVNNPAHKATSIISISTWRLHIRALRARNGTNWQAIKHKKHDTCCGGGGHDGSICVSCLYCSRGWDSTQYHNIALILKNDDKTLTSCSTPSTLTTAHSKNEKGSKLGEIFWPVLSGGTKMKNVAAMNEQIFRPAEWLSSGIKFVEEEKPHQQLDRLDCFFSMEKISQYENGKF